MSKLVVKGIVTQPVEEGLKIEAFHEPEFESYIVFTRLLADTYDVSFSEHFQPYNVCFFFRPGTHEIVTEYPLKDFMYPVQVKKKPSGAKSKNSKAKPKRNDVDEWHSKLGHPHAERFYQLSKQFSEVPSFNRATLLEHQFVRCPIDKATRSPIKRYEYRTTKR